MNTGRWARVVAVTACLLGLLPAACGEDPPATDGAGRRGETCRAHHDCGAGLACVNQVCSVGRFGLAPTGKECIVIECREPQDCCGELTPTCESWQELCSAGDALSCQQFDISCQCDATKWACEENQCIEICTTRGAFCESDAGGVCDGTRCVDCLSDTDCLSTQICTDNECVTQCQEQSDCPYFYDCQSGACVRVGCSNSRECVAFTRNVLAFCDSDRTCQVPCATDLECDAPSSFDFMACIGGLCESVGCETNDECRVLLRAGAFGNDFEVECRVPPPEEDPAAL